MKVEINSTQLNNMLHALGISWSSSGKEVEPNKRYRPKLVAYRNHYQTSDCENWNDLVKKKLAKKSESLGLNYYFVTQEGRGFLRNIGYIFEDRS